MTQTFCYSFLKPKQKEKKYKRITKKKKVYNIYTLGGSLCRSWILKVINDGTDEGGHGGRRRCSLADGAAASTAASIYGPFLNHLGSETLALSAELGSSGGRRGAAGRRFFRSCGHCKGFASSPNPPEFSSPSIRSDIQQISVAFYMRLVSPLTPLVTFQIFQLRPPPEPKI